MHLLIAAAGSGSRMGATKNKLLLPLAGRPVLSWTLESALVADSVSWIGIVGQPIDKNEIMKIANKRQKPVVWIDGGSTRQESVKRGLTALPLDADYVLIHDGARCLVEPELFDRCSDLLLAGEAVVAASPVTDTIKKVDENGFIINTPDRSELWGAQTPQGFSVSELKKGHSLAIKQGWTVTDDASLYEKLGWPVKVINSGPSNIKVTTPFDLTVAEAIIAERNGQ